MNTYITLACLLAVFGLSQGSAIGAIGYGAPYIGSGLGLPAISTANLVKAAPISIIRTQAVPVVTAPVLRTVGVGYGLGGLGYGLGGLGYGLGYGGYGLGLGSKGLGYGGWGNGGWGNGGWGNGGWGYGGLGKHYG